MNENNRRYLAKQMEQQVIRLREQLLQAQRLEEDAALIRQEVAQAMVNVEDMFDSLGFDKTGLPVLVSVTATAIATGD